MAPSAAPSLPRRAVAGLVLGLVLVVAPAVVLAGPGSAQEVPTTTSGVLVAGDPTATTEPATSAGSGGAGPTTTSTTEAPEEDDGGFLGLDLDANQKVWVIVGGLVLVAILLSVLTVLYWRHTKPDRAGVETRRERKERRRREKAERNAAKAEAMVAAAVLAADEPLGDAAADTPEDAEVDPPEDAEGPVDLDELLAAPDPSRSVFGDPDDPPAG